MKTKSLGAKENQAIRAFIRDQIREKYDGSVTKAAKAYGVSQPYLSDVLNEKRGVGVKTLRGIARAADVSIEEITGHVPRHRVIIRRDDVGEGWTHLVVEANGTVKVFTQDEPPSGQSPVEKRHGTW